MINLLLPSRAATIQTLGHPAAGIIGWADSSTNNTGVTVTTDTALQFAAVWCATRVISETIATLPCMLYRRKSDDSRERAKTDDRYWMMTQQPHPQMSAVSFVETLTANMVLTGNCYAEIGYRQGRIRQLDILRPDTVRVEIIKGEPVYRLIDPNRVLMAESMLHVPGLGGDGISGWSVVRYAAQSIGAGIAGDLYAGGQWGNGATPSGVLTHPMRLDKSAREHLRREWEEVHKGSNNAHKVAIMHGGMEFKPISMNNEDAQFLESRQFSVREIARWFRLPPHMLADLADSSVRANIEQQAIEFIVYSLKPWLTRWQQTLNRKLLDETERRTMYFEFLLESLLQGDSAAQATAFSIGRQWGWYSVNDIRRMMNMPPVEGGDVYLQPSNMVPADSDLARGERPEPMVPVMPQDQEEADEEEDEDIDEEAAKELRSNHRQSVQAILDAAKGELSQAIKTGMENYTDLFAALDDSVADKLSNLRTMRREIQSDLVGPLLDRVHGCDVTLVHAAHQLLHEALRCILRGEKAELVRASRCVVRGRHLTAWLDEFYTAIERDVADKIHGACKAYVTLRPDAAPDLAAVVAKSYCDTHKAAIIAASAGNRHGVADRVQSVIETWEDEILTVQLGD